MKTLLALLALTLPSPPAQEPTEPDTGGDLREAEMRMEVFHPRHAAPRELEDLFGRVASIRVTVQDDAGRRFTRYTVQELGDSALLVYQHVDRMAETLELLQRLETAYAQASAHEESEAAAPVPFRPRFVSLETVEKALRPFQKGSSRLSTYFVEDSGLVLLRGTGVEQALAFLRELDVPPPQVLFRCYLVGPALRPGSAPAVALPDALATGLRELVGESSMQVHAVGMLRASLGNHENLSIALQPTDALEYVLAFRPSAYDAEQGALVLERCSVVTRGHDGEPKEVLRTQVSLHAGEYTVLGASGTMPRYVVLYFEALPD